LRPMAAAGTPNGPRCGNMPARQAPAVACNAAAW